MSNAKAKAANGAPRANANTPRTMHYDEIGAHGLRYAIDKDTETLHLVVPFGKAAVKAAPVSKTGKSRLLGNTGGFVFIPEIPGAKLNLVALLPK